jgi:hypothetical protein
LYGTSFVLVNAQQDLTQDNFMLVDIIWTQPSPMPIFQSTRIDDPAHRSRTGKWISALGWLVTSSGGVSLIFGLSDLDNLTILAIGGVIAIPIGLLLITNGQILSGLARIEKTTAVKASQPSNQSPGDSTSL